MIGAFWKCTTYLSLGVPNYSQMCISPPPPLIPDPYLLRALGEFQTCTS